MFTAATALGVFAATVPVVANEVDDATAPGVGAEGVSTADVTAADVGAEDTGEETIFAAGGAAGVGTGATVGADATADAAVDASAVSFVGTISAGAPPLGFAATVSREAVCVGAAVTGLASTGSTGAGKEATTAGGSGTVPDTGLERRLGVGIGGSAAVVAFVVFAAPGLRRSVSTHAGFSVSGDVVAVEAVVV